MMGIKSDKCKFRLGKLVSTPGFQAVSNHADIVNALRRHLQGDWGDCCREDKNANNRALRLGDERIFSVYHTTSGEKFWLITEADRSYTTFLLPSEY